MAAERRLVGGPRVGDDREAAMASSSAATMASVSRSESRRRQRWERTRARGGGEDQWAGGDLGRGRGPGPGRGEISRGGRGTREQWERIEKRKGEQRCVGAWCGGWQGGTGHVRAAVGGRVGLGMCEN